MPEPAISEPTPAAAPSRLVPFPQAPRSPARRSSAVRPWLLGGLALLLVMAAAGGLWWVMRPGNAVRYATAPVTRGAIIRTISATGTVNPELSIIVGTYVSGVIQELFCDYNTPVKKGQVCAKIDPRPYQSVVDQSKANLAVAQAQLAKDQAALAYARITHDRYVGLMKTDSIARDALDNSLSAYEQAQAQILFDQATIHLRQAVLDAAQVNLDYTSIVSPVDGVVVSRNVTMGQTVAASFQTPTLFLIATDLTRMVVDTNVSESDIGGTKLGNPASFTVDAFPKRTFPGIVTQVRQSPQTIQNVVTYDMQISVDNADLALKPGMTASTRIVVAQRSDVLRVPNQALRYVPGRRAQAGAGDQTRIWVLRDGQPTAVPVVPGLDDDSFTEIVSGDLRPDDLAITAEQGTAGNATTAPRLRLG